MIPDELKKYRDAQTNYVPPIKFTTGQIPYIAGAVVVAIAIILYYQSRKKR